jgi:hypothetical protein
MELALPRFDPFVCGFSECPSRQASSFLASGLQVPARRRCCIALNTTRVFSPDGCDNVLRDSGLDRVADTDFSAGGKGFQCGVMPAVEEHSALLPEGNDRFEHVVHFCKGQNPGPVASGRDHRKSTMLWPYK